MTDQQKIHPLHDVESQEQQNPSAPLVARNTSKSDEQQQNHLPPFPSTQQNIPSKPAKKRKSCCCRLFCWIFSILIILIIAIGITIGILFLAFRPKIPKYSVDELTITQFDLSNNNSLSVTFNLTITARNPNKKIGIDYRGGSHISAWYTDTKLCEGALPKFYQGHKNITVLSIPLTGQTQNATGLRDTLVQKVQSDGSVPLHLKVKQPVRIKFGKLKIFKINFRVRCRIVVDNFSDNNSIRIKDSSCKFRFKL
ncbi:NDR1/HIN1-like protein 6 [Cicer arietinum]|uniref:NDR1/HIN1-like protein 6 n=1 Tax=Cicer arietinum TaxID=3827 RepID=A0A1S2XMW5_CICAR|nr:NDR1/HIN1-like protein 6 [Cicer arietinum]